MRRRFKLTPEAFIARDDIAAADRVRERFEKAFQLLALFPRKGHKRDDVHTSEPVLFWPVSSYVMVYPQTGKTIVTMAAIRPPPYTTRLSPLDASLNF